jgi:dGTPase
MNKSGDFLKIREITEKNEEMFLCGRAMFSSRTKGRERFEKLCDLRTEFQRDRDRIIHSKAFRRLKHKTQVFISPVGDHFRTRLTHTLEVVQISRTVARALRINEDLTETIALGHDLGHSPFGHAGEEALDKVFPDGFSHNEHGVRVVQKLEKDGMGLNLTEEVRDGILNHTGNGLASTFEGRIVRICDKITYINHDISDAVSAGGLVMENIPFDFMVRIGDSYSGRVNKMVHSLIIGSSGNIPQMEPEIQAIFNKTYDFMYENVYLNEELKFEETKVPFIIENLYKYFKKNVGKMPEEFVKITLKEGADRAVCDYIAGMTDEFAVNIFKNIFIPKSFAVI